MALPAKRGNMKISQKNGSNRLKTYHLMPVKSNRTQQRAAAEPIFAAKRRPSSDSL